MTLFAAIAIVGLTLVVGSLLYLLVARFSPHGGRNHHVPTNVYFVTGGAMSLLIAFTVSITFQQYTTAQLAVQQEADAVYSMSRAATFMAPPVRDQLRDQLVCYAQEVITTEWPRMAHGQTTIPNGVRHTLDTMDAILVTHVAATGPGLSMWEAANADRLAAHQQRLIAAEDSVPPLLWILLILGSVITIGSLFVYADRSKPAWGHVLVIIGPLFIASAALVVIYFFDHPYSGAPGSITPQAMQTILTQLTENHIGNIPLPRCTTPS